MHRSDPPGELPAVYFDGRSARPRRVWLRLDAGELQIATAPLDNSKRADDPIRVPARRVQWPERQRHGPRLVRLPDGASLQCDDGAAWDAWAAAAGLGSSWLVRAPQSWRATLAMLVLLGAVIVAGYVWALPWASGALLVVVPQAVDQQLGEALLARLQNEELAASALDSDERRRVRALLARVVAAAYAPEEAPRHVLHFHAGGDLGANALALPGGALVITDEMVKMFADDEGVLAGVLGHELGHLRHRHGMRMVIQASLLASASALAFGDFSSVLAGVPAVIGQMAYSRDAEREADEESIRLMQAIGADPAVMAGLFEQLAAARSGKEPVFGIALASHPADAERIARFKSAASAR